jgi:ABC-2 type transport system permease protein
MTTAVVLARTGRAEWARIWSVRSSWILAAAMAVAVVGIGTLVGLDLHDNPPDDQFSSAWDAAQLTAFFALFGAIATAVITATADHGTGGIVTTLQWTPRRGILLAARFAVVAATTTVLAVTLVALASLVVSWLVPHLDLPLGDAVHTLGIAALTCACGTVLGIGLGMLTRSTAAALVTSLALMLILPMIMGNLPFDWSREIAERLPGSAALHLIFGGQFGAVTDTSARVTLGVWALAGLLAGGWRLLRTDAAR